ncbi:MAG: RagB/SusD family nutrient uptake outer membrane protein [Tannerellaceae bacterium]|nr:RagB/SusD family nutrient uptake outer membrane protein [Tannerellaceae bacterium]
MRTRRKHSALLLGPRNVGRPTNFGGWGGFGPTQYLYDSYEDHDKRKTAFFFTEYDGVIQDPPSIRKFWDAETGNVIEDDNLNFILIRYADVLLMKAEALNATDDTGNEKYEALNEVRNRAGLTSVTLADNLSKEAFAEILLDERLHELCCEHMRRWDLIRFGKLIEYMKERAGVAVQPYHILYPIPQAAMDANEAITENNPGY